jgi:hypothetical protein
MNVKIKNLAKVFELLVFDDVNSIGNKQGRGP